MLEAKGCLVIFLSPYSPDYNPIELCFAQLKRFLRKNRSAARSHLEIAVDMGMRRITRENMINYARHCGYENVPVMPIMGRVASAVAHAVVAALLARRPELFS